MDYKIAIIDDEMHSAVILKDMLEKYQSANKDISLSSELFTSADRFLQKFKGNYSIIFLDILMPEITGLRLAMEIRKVDSAVMIVFVTSTPPYAIESYAVHACDYILKPLEYNSFKLQLDYVFNMVKHDIGEAKIKLASGARKKILKVNDILFVETQGHNIIVHLSNEDFTTRGSIKYMVKLLE